MSETQSSGAAGSRSPGWLLSTLQWLLPGYHQSTGYTGHRVAGMGFYLSFLSLQILVEIDGEGHK